LSRGPAARDARLPLTAVVASHDEAPELERCLPTLAFCDEVIVIDIASEDATAEVAEAHGARVVRHDLVPIAEWARLSVVPTARNDWLLFTDPDEELPAALEREVRALLPEQPDDVALVWAPIQFWFGGRPLRGTVWGGENRRRLLVRRDGVELSRTVFGGTHLRPGFRATEIPFRPELAIRHRWVDGYRDWLRKHRRYLALERRERLESGQVTGVRSVALKPLASFYDCYVRKRGYLDGGTGLALSVLWSWFRTSSEVQLLRDLRHARP
jgi:glycosyltransferase involved in cell wall biosynthesis